LAKNVEKSRSSVDRGIGDRGTDLRCRKAVWSHPGAHSSEAMPVPERVGVLLWRVGARVSETRLQEQIHRSLMGLNIVTLQDVNHDLQASERV